MRFSALAAAAGLLLTGCGARLETRTLCYTLNDASVPAASGAGAIETDLPYDLGVGLPVVTQPGVSYSLALQDVDLAPGRLELGIDLGGVHELDLSVLPPSGSTLPEEELIRYVNATGTRSAELRATAARDVDLRPYLAGGVVSFHLKASGALPRRSWSADAQACFLLNVNVR